MTSLAFLRAGPLTTVQDLGRPGLAHLGVPPSGAADRSALELGNRVVGNDPDAAGLEASLVGPTVRFDGPAVVALAGADAGATLSGRRVVRGEAVVAVSGDVLELGRCIGGARAYVCVRGGIDVEDTLGSRSTDLLTGLGPAPLRDGHVLRIGSEAGLPPPRAEPVVAAPVEPVLRVVPGPRHDWFAPGALDVLLSAVWGVTPATNRVGIRLDGPSLERRTAGELLSEGMVTGALQVPPSGRPILLLVDHPTTGGYPVIAVVATADLSAAGQLAPGDTVRFMAFHP